MEPTQAISISMAALGLQPLFASVFDVWKPAALISTGSLQRRQNPMFHSGPDEEEYCIILSFINDV